MIDIAALERDREQLWAEAVARFEAGELWWLETPELKELAKAVQATRYKADTFEEPIKEYLEDHANKKVTNIDELLEHLGMDPKKKKENHSAVVRIARILKHRLGFTRRRVEDKGKKGARKGKGGKRDRRWEYWRP